MFTKFKHLVVGMVLGTALAGISVTMAQQPTTVSAEAEARWFVGPIEAIVDGGIRLGGENFSLGDTQANLDLSLGTVMFVLGNEDANGNYVAQDLLTIDAAVGANLLSNAGLNVNLGVNVPGVGSPTGPTNPSNPTNPNNPSNPTNPNNPGAPANPSNPSDSNGGADDAALSTDSGACVIMVSPSTASTTTADNSGGNGGGGNGNGNGNGNGGGTGPDGLNLSVGLAVPGVATVGLNASTGMTWVVGTVDAIVGNTMQVAGHNFLLNGESLPLLGSQVFASGYPAGGIKTFLLEDILTIASPLEVEANIEASAGMGNRQYAGADVNAAITASGNNGLSIAANANLGTLNSAGQLVDSAGNVIQTVVDAAGNTVTTVVGTASGVVDTVVDTTSGVVNTVVDTAGGVVTTVVDTTGGIAQQVGNTVGGLLGGLLP